MELTPGSKSNFKTKFLYLGSLLHVLANLLVWNSMSYFFFLCPWRKKYNNFEQKKMLFSWNRIKGLKLRCFEAFSRGDAIVEEEFESSTSSTTCLLYFEGAAVEETLQSTAAPLYPSRRVPQ